MRFPEFFESAAANVPAQPDAFDDIDGLAPDWTNPAPAPWFVDPPGPAEGDHVTTIVIPEGDPDRDGPPAEIEDHDWGESGFSSGGTDAVACYVPWHADPARWGIYFFERPFFAF